MQITDFLNIEAIVDHENEEEVDKDEDGLSKSVKSKVIVCLTTVENSLLVTVNLLDGKTGVYSDSRGRSTKVGDDEKG